MIKDARLKPGAVKTLLRFIYSDFKDAAGITDASVWDVLYAGTNYDIYFIFHI